MRGGTLNPGKVELENASPFVSAGVLKNGNFEKVPPKEEYYIPPNKLDLSVKEELKPKVPVKTILEDLKNDLAKYILQLLKYPKSIETTINIKQKKTIIFLFYPLF